MIKKVFSVFLLVVTLWAEAGLFGDKKVTIESFDGAQHGLVVLQISTNSNYQRGMSNWDFVTVKNVGEGKSFRLLPVHDFKKYGSVVFAGYLEPGQYMVEDVYEDTEYAGGIIFTETQTVEASRHNLNFDVALNQITDIGTVLLHPQHHGIDNFNVIKSFSMIRVKDDGLDLAELLIQKYKNKLSDVSLNAAKTGAIQSPQPAELSSGLPFKYYHYHVNDERFMLHRHGLISRKVKDGEWQQFSTGRVQQFNVIEKVAGGYLLGGEYGALLFSEDLSDWRSLDLLSVEANVMNIQRADDVITLTVHMPDLQVNTYQLSADLSNIQQVGSEKRKYTNYRLDAYNQHESIVQSNGIVVKKNTGFNKTTVQMPGQSHDQQVYSGKPRDFFVSGYNYTREVFVVDENNMFLISSPIKRYSKNSYRLKSFKKPYELKFYYGSINEPLPHDDTNAVSSIKQRCSTLVPEISTESHLYLSCINGDLLLSQDQGKTWQTDYKTGINAL